MNNWIYNFAVQCIKYLTIFMGRTKKGHQISKMLDKNQIFEKRLTQCKTISSFLKANSTIKLNETNDSVIICDLGQWPLHFLVETPISQHDLE